MYGAIEVENGKEKQQYKNKDKYAANADKLHAREFVTVQPPNKQLDTAPARK